MSLTRRAWLALLAPEEHFASFEAAFQLIRDLHWEPAQRDWEALHQRFAPEARQAATREQLRRAIRRMLDALGDSHYGLYAKESLEAARAAGPGDAGLSLRVVDGEAVVVKVDGQSAGARAGVTPGLVLVSVRGESMAGRLQRAPADLRDMAARAALVGQPGDEIEAVFDDGPRRLTLAAPAGRRAPGFGLMPPLPVDCRHRWLDRQTGYLTCNLFFDPEYLAGQFQQAMDEFEKARGLVIDLRGNPGGLGALAMGLAGWFITEPDQYLGTLKSRATKLRFAVNPRLPHFKGRLAILVDRQTASTSEIYAAGLRDLGRARIFGERTAGAALPSQFRPLPNGDVLQVAFATYVSASGDPLEARGVTPDAVIPWSKTALRAGRDAALDAAQAWCQA